MIKYLKYLFYSIISLIPIVSFAQISDIYYKYLDCNLPIDERVDDLISRMSLEEKISQMMSNAPAIPRLKVPAYNWWNECLHGIARSPYKVTSYPQAIAMAATWDTDAIYKMAVQSSDEGRAIYNDALKKGKTGIFLGLTYWSPNINIFRDPRWGRGQETYGEDPYLTSKIGVAFVKGLQGDDSNYLKSSACAKHYAVHSGPEWNRHTYNAEVSNFDLWDTYLPAFESLVKEGKVTGVMCAYNSFWGQPCCGNDILMMDILRNQWGFEGYVTSDCGAIEDFYKNHKTHKTRSEASADAVLHGTDCECSSNGAYQALVEAIGEGLITEEQLDESLKRLFKIRFMLGMFDPEERNPYSKIPITVLESKEHQDHALEMARKSIVLLKNQNNILPLNKNIKKIAVVGPNANSESVLLANYYGYPSKIVSLLEGIKNQVGKNTEVIYRQGIGLVDNLVFKSTYKENLFSFNGYNGFEASYYDNMDMLGDAKFKRLEKKIDYKWGDGQDIGGGIITRQMSAQWNSTFVPDKTEKVCFRLHADDRAHLYIDGVKQNKIGVTDNLYEFNVVAGKKYSIRIDYWQYADNAEITFDVGVLERTDTKLVVEEIKDADVIVFAGGLSSRLEGEEMGVEIDGFKKGDRTSIDLPLIQKQMLRDLKATGKPVILVLMTGGAIGLEWESKNIPVIINAWYGGQSGGQAIADILFGDCNPSGKLPITFYRDVKDLPDFEDYGMENRTYRYFSKPVVYPFGYGLSYTEYLYENLQLRKEHGGVEVSIDISNIGHFDGEEVVQLYISHMNKTNIRVPIRSLRGFRRIFLKKGEKKNIKFFLTRKDLSIVEEGGDLKFIPGMINISVGGCQYEMPGVNAPICSQIAVE